ncbi:hypothetical protein Pfo_018678, partial [Paulownia fortunei]
LHLHYPPIPSNPIPPPMTTGKRIPNSPLGSPSSSSNKDHDRFLPIANVSRIMKKSLPENAKISKEAKETVQECVSEFISFVTGEASDKCQREKRKTINGDDLLWAMTTLGFENYVGPLKVYLSKYRETEGEKNTMARQEDGSSSPANDGDQNYVEKITARPDYLQNFNSGNYHHGQVIINPKSRQGVISCPENFLSSGGGFDIGHGVEW